MAKRPTSPSIEPTPRLPAADVVDAARVEILKRELAVSRELMVRARNGLEASRQATAAVRADLAAEQETVRRLDTAVHEARDAIKGLQTHNADLQQAVDALRGQVEAREQTVAALQQDIAHRQAERDMILGSFSWRITRPLRFAMRRVRALRRVLDPRTLHARLTERAGYDAVRRSGVFDADWYRITYPDVAASNRDPLRHFMHAGWKENRWPGPEFDTAFYRYAHDDIGGQNPLLHYVLYGRKEHRPTKAPEPPPAAPDDRSRPIAPILPAEAASPGPKIVVAVHAYYPDVFDALCPRLKSLPGRFTLLASTPNEAVQQAVLASIERHGLDVDADVRVTPNRGRNFGPLISDFGPVVLNHDLLLHLHTKKSLHGGGEQSAWRDDIVDGLVGLDGVTDAVLNLFAAQPTVGVVFTRTFRQMTYWANHWLQNVGQAAGLFARLGVRDYNLRGYIDYPVGGMFWARVEAIRPLFEAGITYEDFPPEAGQLDGTIAHAIERSFVDLARSRGFTFAEVDRLDNLFRLGWSDKNLERYSYNSLARLKDEIDAAKLISFDLFDTVLLRPSLSPDAVQRYAGHLLAQLYPDAPDFFSARKTAEHAARAAKAWAGDVGLDEIYAQFPAGFSADALDRARALELETEQRLALVRPPIVEALAYAKARGKRVVAISDTYFGKAEVEALLESAGVRDAFDAIYLSSECGARKDRGDLWTLLSGKERVDARAWLHVGDNEVSDMQRAGDRGLCTFHAMNPVTLLMQKRFLSPATARAADEAQGWADALLLGPAGARLAADPFPVGGALGTYRVGSAHDLGYCAYGPALFAFTAWLARRPDLANLDRLYFLSREGWALQPIYDAIRDAVGDETLPPSAYLHISRRAVLLAGQAIHFDPTAITGDPEFNGDLAGLLKGRLGVELSDGPNQPIVLPPDAAAAAEAIGALRERIVAQAEPEAEALKAYLAQQGLTARSGVVDVGYRATIQAGLQKITGHGLTGFYCGTFPEAEAVEAPQADGSKGSAAGYFGDRVDPRGHDPIVQLAILFEAVLTAPQGQLDRFVLDADGAAQPRFLPNSRSADEIEILGQLHAGALAYTTDLLRWYGPRIVDLAFNPAAALEPLTAFSEGRLIAPPDVLRTLRVDDAYCGYDEHEVGINLAAE